MLCARKNRVWMRFSIGARKRNLWKNSIFEGSLRALTENTRKMSTFVAGCYPAARRALAAHNARWSWPPGCRLVSNRLVWKNWKQPIPYRAATQLYVMLIWNQTALGLLPLRLKPFIPFRLDSLWSRLAMQRAQLSKRNHCWLRLPECVIVCGGRKFLYYRFG